MSIRETLKSQGYYKANQVLTAVELQILRARADNILAGLDDAHRARFKSNGSLCNLAEQPDFADLISHPKLIELVSSASEDPDPRWTGGYLISKPPGGAPLFWHQDWWGWDEEISYDTEPPQVFIMIYLVDTTINNGCLRVVPNSHMTPHALHQSIAAHSEALARVENPDDALFQSHPDEQAIQVKAGDVLLGDARLIHGAFANQSGKERPLLTLWYTPSFKRLPDSIKASYQAMLRRDTENDVDRGNTIGSRYHTVSDWPAVNQEMVWPYLPDFQGNTKPLTWNRNPDLEKLSCAEEA